MIIHQVDQLPSDYDYTVMVDKLISNTKIQFKFVEGVFSSNPDNITVVTSGSWD